jgi:hypothetical protein
MGSLSDFGGQSERSEGDFKLPLGQTERSKTYFEHLIGRFGGIGRKKNGDKSASF